MAKNYYDITLALAGICQSARLVQQLAHQGHCDADALHVSLNSIIDMNPSSTLAVFGGSEANLRVGLETLLGVLNASSRQGLNAELTRYTLSLMVLERKLSSAKGALDTLGNRINGLQRQLEHFDLQSETLMSAMAAIYVDVISPLGPRIQVTGSLPLLILQSSSFITTSRRQCSLFSTCQWFRIAVANFSAVKSAELI